jgi:hypothetical protein
MTEPASPAPREGSLARDNLQVIFFNWLPALGCLAAGVMGVITGMQEAPRPTIAGGLYLLAGTVGFAAFGWLWRR